MTDMERYLNSLDQTMLEHARLARSLVTELEATELDSDLELAALQTQAIRLSDELRRCQWDLHLELATPNPVRTAGRPGEGR